jgi:hypothetical protein
LTGVLLNPDLSAVDLTDATVTLSLFQMTTGLITQLPAIIAGTDPTKGLVQHDWQPGETNISGAYFYKWQVAWPSNLESFPNDGRGLVLSIEATA